MSRIGNRPIALTLGATVSLEDRDVVVIGKKGTLRLTIPPGVSVVVREGIVTVERETNQPQAKAFHGLTRALIANMVHGVSEGYSKQLKIVGVGFRAEVTGQGLRLLLGFSHPIDVPTPPGIAFTVDKNVITVTGIDKQLVGETAARIRSFKKPEPYKGKGIMYTDEQVRRKPGKAAKTVGAGTGA